MSTAQTESELDSETTTELQENGHCRAAETEVMTLVKNNEYGKADNKIQPLTKVPDGGWGWVVVFGTLVIGMLVPTLLVCYGVFINEFLTVFPHVSKTATAWVPAIAVSVWNFTGPITSILIGLFSCRSVTVVGGLILSAGLCLTYWAYNIETLYLTYGVLGGIGAGLSFSPGIVLVSRYFDKRRGMASGLCVAGAALGQTFMPTVVDELLQSYGYRGGALILGGLMLHICLAGMLFRPVPLLPANHSSITTNLKSSCNGDLDRSWKSPSDESNTQLDKRTRLRTVSIDSALPDIPEEEEEFFNEGNKKNAFGSLASVHLSSCYNIFVAGNAALAEEKKQPPSVQFNQLLDLSLLKEPTFCLLTLSTATCTFAFPNFVFYMPVYGLQMGADRRDSAQLVSYIAVADVIGRVTVPWLSDVVAHRVRRRFLFVASCLGIAVMMAAVTMCERYEMVWKCLLGFGLSAGACVGLIPSLFLEYTGLERFPSVLGILAFAQGVFFLIGTPLIGSLMDSTGDIRRAFWALFLLQLIGSLMPLMHVFRDKEPSANNLSHNMVLSSAKLNYKHKSNNNGRDSMV